MCLVSVVGFRACGLRFGWDGCLWWLFCYLLFVVVVVWLLFWLLWFDLADLLFWLMNLDWWLFIDAVVVVISVVD